MQSISLLLLQSCMETIPHLLLCQTTKVGTVQRLHGLLPSPAFLRQPAAAYTYIHTHSVSKKGVISMGSRAHNHCITGHSAICKLSYNCA